jgi:SAM-dependent methyltransferase
MSTYLKSVRNQYESYPYPIRDPDNEKKGIFCTNIDFLGKINHYCFNGRLDLNKYFRVLIAGGGTGDATVHLAEQIRGSDAEIIYIDISSTSMEIAKQRAEVRGLNNITWLQGSLLDLSNMDIGNFDYINCSGVLHHLEDPVEGLKALRSHVKDPGAIGVMVYGKYGRTGIYHMQELMSLINAGEAELSKQLENTRAILDYLPNTNWLAHGPITINSQLDDSNLVDLLLHSQDRPYSVLELYQWLESCGLNMVGFVTDQALYKPENYIKKEELLTKIKKLPKRMQQAIAENIAGNIFRHVFYVSPRTDTIASIDELDNVPYFSAGAALEFENSVFYENVKDLNEGMTVTIDIPYSGLKVKLQLGKFTKYFFKYIDGSRTIKEILHKIRNEEELKPKSLADEEILKELKLHFRNLNELDLMFLRHKEVRRYKTLQELQAPVMSKYGMKG